MSLLSNNTAVQVPSSVLVPAGQASATFNIATSSVPTLLASTIRALLGTCSGIGVDLNVQAPVLSGLSVAPSSVRLLGNATGTVTSNGPAPAGGLVVSLNGNSTLGSLLLNLPASVTIPAGQNSATFTIRPTLSLGSLLTGIVNSTITATNGGVSVNSPLTILP